MITMQEMHFLTVWVLSSVTGASSNRSTFKGLQLLWRSPQPGFKFELKPASASLLETLPDFKLDWVLSVVPQSFTKSISCSLWNFFLSVGQGRELKSVLSSKMPPDSCSQITDVLQEQTGHSALPFTSQVLFSSKTTDLWAGKPFTQK